MLVWKLITFFLYYCEISFQEDCLTKKLYFSIDATAGSVQSHRKFHLTSGTLAKRSYYEVLGISRNSSAKDIKKAYYQLAKKYHPDTNKEDPNASKKFQEVSEAYEVLSDETKRKEYDTWGATSEQMGMGGPSRGASRNQDTRDFNWQFKSTINPEELFRKIFGEAGFKSGGFSDFEDYAESKYGFGAAQEVILLFINNVLCCCD